MPRRPITVKLRSGKTFTVPRRGGMRMARRVRRINRYSKYQLHKYKRFAYDYTIYNTYTGGVSDLVLNVDGVNQGKNYLGVQLGNLFASVNGTSAIGGSIAFRMDMLERNVELAQLYDKYKLHGVLVSITPLSNFASASNLGTLPMLTTAVDTDDNTVPPDENTLREYGNCKIRRLAGTFKQYIRPKMVSEIASAGGFAQSAVVTQPKFLDWNHTDIPHFGLKFWLDNVLLGNTTNVNALFKITLKYYFTCSQTR